MNQTKLRLDIEKQRVQESKKRLWRWQQDAEIKEEALEKIIELTDCPVVKGIALNAIVRAEET